MFMGVVHEDGKCTTFQFGLHQVCFLIMHSILCVSILIKKIIGMKLQHTSSSKDRCDNGFHFVKIMQAGQCISICSKNW